MEIYLLGYAFLLIGLFLWERTYPKTRLIYFLGFLYIAFIVIFRGNVGTDTGNYESIIANISLNNWLKQPTELGFNLLVALLNLLGFSSVITLRILTAIYISLIIPLLITSEKNIRQFIAIFFIPATIYIFSMNALRVGIAINLLLISLNLFQKKRNVSLVVFLIAISFHVTVSLIIPILFLFQKNNSKKIITAFSLTLLLFAGGAIYYEHIYNKLILYSNYSSPNLASGLSDVILFILFLRFFYLYPTNRHFKIGFSCVATLLIAMSFIIAKFSYGGLRILQLYTLLLPYTFLYISNLRYGMFILNKKLFYSLYLTSIIATIFTLRNFIDSSGQAYGFIPYSFIFQ